MRRANDGRAKVLTAMGCCDGALGARADPLQPTETAPTEALPAAAPADPGLPIAATLRAALLDFNTFDESEAARHLQRMQIILETAELQAYSMTLYAGWRDVVAAFVARRTGARPHDLVPQTIGWLMLGVALAAHEHWLGLAYQAGAAAMRDALGEAFDAMAAGVGELADKPA